MGTDLKTAKLIDNTPPSIAYDVQVQSASGAFDNQCYEILDETGQICFIPNIMDLTDETLVDILAWQFSVDYYDPRKPFHFRKRLVQMSIQWHKTKGTVALVNDVIETYWPGGAYIQEWFEYRNPFPPQYPIHDPVTSDNPDGAGTWHDRYRFRIIVQQDVVSPEDEAQVLALIDRFKPVSRWPEDSPIIRARSSTGTIYWAGVTEIFKYRRSAAPTNYP